MPPLYKTVRAAPRAYRKSIANNLRTEPDSFKFMPPLLLLFLRDGKKGVHILLDCLILLDLASGGSVFGKKRVLPFSECGQFLSMRSAEGTGTAPSFFSSLAAASNKIISLSWPRRNFFLCPWTGGSGHRPAGAGGRWRRASSQGTDPLSGVLCP